MNIYRGCMLSFVLLIVGLVSIAAGLSLGPLGLFLFPALVSFGYLLIDTILVELLWLDRDAHQ